MSELLQNPASFMLAFAAVVSLLLFLNERGQRRKLESEGDKFIQEAREKGWDTLHDSIKKSQDILSEAELEGIKVVAGNKLQTSKVEKEFADKLNEAINQSRQALNLAQAKLIQFMQDLQKRSGEFEEASLKVGEQRINQLFDRIETNISNLLIQTEQKATSAIDLELKATRQLIDTYKNEQLKLIDENIIAMLEQTLSIVLAKKLSLKDQLDLIYEALEKAKVEKFIV